ncbi:hypothetical protein [Streptomyces goshikiensis]
MRRWPLPPLLAALLAASGCVTVHPAPTRPVSITLSGDGQARGTSR